MQSLASRNIVKIAAHSDGHHYLALSANGEVFSWGCGDGGRLVHGDTVYVINNHLFFFASGLNSQYKLVVYTSAHKKYY